ncbi:MAG: hypothetical protein QOG51_475, partial [Verrucomicrobiota bacterium]
MSDVLRKMAEDGITPDVEPESETESETSEEDSRYVSSRAAQSARDLTGAGLNPCGKATPFVEATWGKRKLIRISVVRSLAVCAARDDNYVAALA